jgi:hypothetical protein
MVVEDIADAAGLVFVASQMHEVFPVTLDIDNRNAWDVLVGLGNAVGQHPRVNDGVLIFERDERGEVVMAGPFYQEGEELARVLSSLGGVDLYAIGSRLVGEVVDDARVAAIMDELQAAAPAQWEVSVWLLEVNRSAFDVFALELRPELGISMVAGPGAGIVARGLLEITLDVDSNRSRSRVLTHAKLLVASGEVSEIRATDRVPIAERTTSPQGTVSTTGYSYVEAGLVIQVEAREVPGGAHVTVRPELSSIVGFVGEAPRIARRALTAGGYVEDGGWLVLAGLEQESESASAGGPLRTSLRRSGERTAVLALFNIRRLHVPRNDP